MSVAEIRPGCPARRHGDVSAYSRYGCTCADAREAWRLHRKRGREGRRAPGWVDAVGVARRLQALAVMGWGLEALSGRSGLSVARLDNLRCTRCVRVIRRTAEKIGALYEELKAVPGPSPRAAALARGRGWAPWLAWHDIDDPQAEPDWTAGGVRWRLAHAPHISRSALELATLAHAGEILGRSRAVADLAAREPRRVAELVIALADLASSALPTAEGVEVLQAAYAAHRRERERTKKAQQRARAG